MIDTHCHLDDHQFADDLAAVIARSREANVNQWVLIGYDPLRWKDAVKLAASIPGMRHTLGVHPACAEQWSEEIAHLLQQEAMATRAVAIGEAGLDFYRDNAPLEVQAPAFTGQLQVARQLGLPVIIHMRDAEDEMLELLRAETDLPTLIFHSFDGTGKLMDYVIETGSYVGIGGLATRQKSEALRAQLTRVPTDRILLETDSPYLVPARQKHRRNQPAHIATIADMMGEHLGMTPASLAAHTTENAIRVFGLNHD